MLAASNRGRVIGRPTCVEIANFRTEADKSPKLEIHAAAEVEYAVVDSSRGGVRATLKRSGALFVVGPSASDRKIGGDAAVRKQLDANSRRHKERGEVASECLVG